MSQRPDPRRQLVGEAEIKRVADAVREAGQAYVRARTVDVDLRNNRIGAALGIISDRTDLLEVYRDTGRGVLYQVQRGDER